MQVLSTSGSFSIAQTFWRGAESWTSPFIVIAIGIVSVFVLQVLSFGRCGEKPFPGHTCAVSPPPGVGGRLAGR
jgi:hypothetical protein